MKLKDANEYYLERIKNPLPSLIYKKYKNIITLDKLQKELKKKDINLEKDDCFLNICRILIKSFNQNIFYPSLTTNYNFQIKNLHFFDFSNEIKELLKIFKNLQFLKEDLVLNKSIPFLNDLGLSLKNIEKENFFLKDLLDILVGFFLFKNDNWQIIYKKRPKNNPLEILIEYFEKFLNGFRGYFLIKNNNKKVNDTCLMKKIFNIVPILKKLYKYFTEDNYEELQKILSKKPFLLTYKFPLFEFNPLLHLAIERQKEKLVDMILEMDPDSIYIKNKEGMTPLFVAIRSSNLLIIKKLLEKGSDINEKDKKKNNLIYTSIMFSKPQITKFLIEKGCDINNQNYLGRTPLMKSIYLCQKEKTEMLLDCENINVDLVDMNGRTALHMACWGNEGGRNGKKVQNVIFNEFLEGLQLLLKKNPNLDIKDRDGNTAILVSCSTNAMDCVKVWVQQKANFNSINLYGENSLLIAIRYGNFEIVKYLLENDCVEMKLKNIKGNNVFKVSADGNQNDLLEFLLEFYANYDINFIFECLDFIFVDLKKYTIFLNFLLSNDKVEFEQFFFKLNLFDIERFIEISGDLTKELEKDFFLLLCEHKQNLQPFIFLNAFKKNKIDLLIYLSKIFSPKLEKIFKVIETDIIVNFNSKIFENKELCELIISQISYELILSFRDKINRTFFMILIENKKIEIFTKLLEDIKKQERLNEELKKNLIQKDNFNLTIHDLVVKHQNYWIMDLIEEIIQDNKSKIEKKIKFVKCEITQLENWHENDDIFLQHQHDFDIDFSIFDKIKKNTQIEKISDFLSNSKCSDFYEFTLSDLNISVEFVDTQEKCLNAFNNIYNYNVIGIDYEYDAALFNSLRLKTINLLQISVEDKVFIFDCYQIYEILKQQVKELFMNQTILKLVHGSYYDLKLLFSFFQAKKSFFVDLAEAYKIYFNYNQNIGLAVLSKKFLDFELDKSLQCSNWNIRPLPNILVKYAAIDAFILLPIFQKFLRMQDSEDIILKVLKKSQNIYKKYKDIDKIKDINIID